MRAYRLMTEDGNITVVFAADLVHVDRFCADISRILSQRGLQRYDFVVQILLRESLNNAVIHGCKSDGTKNVEVRVSIEEKRLRIEVSDQGSGFPWQDMIARVKDDRATSGRGCEIFQKYSTTFSYNDSGNRLTLVVALAS
jgi:serine/threonine-protein kinase RsbW